MLPSSSSTRCCCDRESSETQLRQRTLSIWQVNFSAHIHVIEAGKIVDELNRSQLDGRSRLQSAQVGSWLLSVQRQLRVNCRQPKRLHLRVQWKTFFQISGQRFGSCRIARHGKRQRSFRFGPRTCGGKRRPPAVAIGARSTPRRSALSAIIYNFRTRGRLLRNLLVPVNDTRLCVRLWRTSPIVWRNKWNARLKTNSSNTCQIFEDLQATLVLLRRTRTRLLGLSVLPLDSSKNTMRPDTTARDARSPRGCE